MDVSKNLQGSEDGVSILGERQDINKMNEWSRDLFFVVPDGRSKING